MAPAVPLHDSISIEELSAKLQLGPEILRRLAAYSSTYGLFQFSTSQKDRIMHTPFSAVLARGAYAEAAEWDVSIQPYSALMLYDALAKFKNCNGPEEAPFKLAFDTEKNFYLWHRQEKKWGECFRKGMESEQADKRLAPQNCLRALDWRKLDGKTVVDVSNTAILFNLLAHDGSHHSPARRVYWACRKADSGRSSYHPIHSARSPRDIGSRHANATGQSHHFPGP